MKNSEFWKDSRFFEFTIVVKPFFAGWPWYKLRFSHLTTSSFPSNLTTRFVTVFTTVQIGKTILSHWKKTRLPLMPNNVGYNIKAPLSSHKALFQRPGIFPSGPGSSNSLSTANRRPNSMSSTLYTAVPACCISWIAERDSSYLRVSLPDNMEKTRICRSGRENVTKDDESGDSTRHVGVDFDYLSEIRFTVEYKLHDMYLFELVQVCCTFEWPEARDVFGQFEWLQWLPIFNEPTFICRYYGIIAVTILQDHESDYGIEMAGYTRS
jgi:hypothetical protein